MTFIIYFIGCVVTAFLIRKKYTKIIDAMFKNVEYNEDYDTYNEYDDADFFRFLVISVLGIIFWPLSLSGYIIWQILELIYKIVKKEENEEL